MRTHAQKPKRTPDPKPDAAAKTVAPTPAEPGELSLALALHAAGGRAAPPPLPPDRSAEGEAPSGYWSGAFDAAAGSPAQGDPDETEADAVARNVVAGRQAVVRGAAGRGGASAVAGPALAARLARSEACGRPLAGPVRAGMEAAMGADFGGVRIHTGSDADALSRGLGAAAFAWGDHLFFRQGGFEPESRRGRALLAHELAHTRQQRIGPRAVVQRHPAPYAPPTDGAEPKEEGDKVLIGKLDLEPVLEALLGGLYRRIKGSRYLSIGASHEWLAVVGGPGGETAPGVKWTVGDVEAQARLDKHLIDITADIAKVAATTGTFSLRDKDNPLIKFAVESEFSVASVEMEGLGFPKVAPVKLEIKGNYEIDASNAAQFGFLSEEDRKSLAERNLTVKGTLKISIAFELKPLQEYLENLSKKALKENLAEGHAEKEKVERRKAREAKARKNDARAKSEKLKQELRHHERDLKQIRGDKTLSPAEAEKKIASLEDDIASKVKESARLEEVARAEEAAMKKAHNAANAERKAGKRITRELKPINKAMRKFEEQAGRYRELVEKLERKVEKQMKVVDRVLKRLAERSAKWVEQKARRVVGEWLAKKAAALVAKLILRAIPIIGYLFLLWDALTLLWDVAKALWNVLDAWLHDEEIIWGGGGDESAGSSDGAGEQEGTVPGGHGSQSPHSGAHAGTETQDGKDPGEGVDLGGGKDHGDEKFSREGKDLTDEKGLGEGTEDLGDGKDLGKGEELFGDEDAKEKRPDRTDLTDARDLGGEKGIGSGDVDDSGGGKDPVPHGGDGGGGDTVRTTPTPVPGTSGPKLKEQKPEKEEVGDVKPYKQLSPDADTLLGVSYEAQGLDLKEPLQVGKEYLFTLVYHYGDKNGVPHTVVANGPSAFLFHGWEGSTPVFRTNEGLSVMHAGFITSFYPNFKFRIRRRKSVLRSPTPTG